MESWEPGNEREQPRYGPHGNSGGRCQFETRDYDAMDRLVREQCLNAERKLQNRRGEGWATKDIGWDHGQQQPAQHRNAAGAIITPHG